IQNLSGTGAERSGEARRRMSLDLVEAWKHMLIRAMVGDLLGTGEVGVKLW
ncbi:hypothetical protein KI387_041439, partial [Taxus chinensis]